MKNILLLVFTLPAVIITASCSDLGYYSQSVSGHLSVMAKKQPIEEAILDSDSTDALKLNLQTVLKIRKFAENDLFLPVHDSFSTYADIKQPYVVWNVVAAPQYSLAAKEWCYPITGCLPYRGYFNKNEADSFALSLQRRGLDAYTYGVPAYSTLGWFDDPVLNTFIHYPGWALAGLIFHEMAHQLVYAKNDGDFNEAFASAIELEGVRRWLVVTGSEEEQANYRLYKSREDQFFELVMKTRIELLSCYDGRNGKDTVSRQQCKQDAFLQMKKAYQVLRLSWSGYSGYDSWFEGGLNNARFISAQTYRHYIPAFNELLRRHEGDLTSFYQAARKLSVLSAGERKMVLNELRTAAIAANSSISDQSENPAENQSPKSGI